MLDELGDELSLSTAALAVVTALPLVCFGPLSPLAPALAARIGFHRAALAATAVLLRGTALRLGGALGLFTGTVLLAGGIAVVNVLLPALVRAEYGPRSAAPLGATTGSMAFSASLGAGFAQPRTDLTGSAVTGLALWALPVLAALLGLALVARVRPERTETPARPGRRTAILRDRVALAVMAFFGLQSLSFYEMLTWLPAVLEDDAGVSPVAAGGLVALAASLGAPLSLVVPPLAVRRPDQKPWVLVAFVPAAVGVVGLLVAPTAAPVLFSVLYGFGTGAAFPLAMTLVLQRSRDVAQTGRLSAASQSLGYLVAATGPLGVGLLHEATGGWRGGLVLLLAVLVGQAAVGLVAARPKLTGGPRRLTHVDHHLFQISREALGADAGAGARPGSDRIAVRNRAA
ncbi:MAG: MFS transporter [Actinomycetota bacterium]|nr:MFS transporter [Actinomycetota bacterium]